MQKIKVVQKPKMYMQFVTDASHAVTYDDFVAQ